MGCGFPGCCRRWAFRHKASAGSSECSPGGARFSGTSA